MVLDVGNLLFLKVLPGLLGIRERKHTPAIVTETSKIFE
jgi:hypothetical protein